MVAYHRSQGADATVAVYHVPREEAHRFGVLDLDANGRIIDFQEKPKHPRGEWASMGVYVFNKDVLVEQLQADADLARRASTTSAGTSSRASSNHTASSVTSTRTTGAMSGRSNRTGHRTWTSSRPNRR